MRNLIFIFFLTASISCKNDRVEVIPNVDHIEVDFSIHRFDQAVLDMDTFAPINSYKKLSERFPKLSDLYFSQIIGLEANSDDPDAMAIEIGRMVKDQRVRYIFDTIQTIYPNLSDVKEDFDLAFKYMSYYLPGRHVPDIYTIASEYTIGNFLFADEEGHDALGLGLDFYLGEQFPYGQAVPNNTSFSRYLTRTFNKDHIVKKTLTPLVQDWLGRLDGSRLIDKMIHDGKERFLLDKIMPFVSDTVIHEYSLDQLTFCVDNEADMWAFFLTEDLLYTQEPYKINKYMSPSPKSAGMPDGAPGRTAGYIGYKIIQQYMLRNPNTSLDELIDNQDAQDILTKSKYRPRRKSS